MALPADKNGGAIGRFLTKAHPRLIRLVPFAALFCVAAWCLVSLHSNFSGDDAEPEILNQAWRLATGKAIYGDIHSPPYILSSYTPLYYAVVAALLSFSGLSFIPAKLLSLAAALFIGAAFMELSRKWRGSRRDGLWTALFLFLVPAFLFNAVRCHPQMTAVAFSLWSFVFFLKNRPYATLFISPVLAVFAIYSKQTQIALPLAMILYLALRNRRWLMPYAAMLALAGLVPFLWLQWATGGAFFLNSVAQNGLTYSAPQIPLILIHHAGPVFLGIGLAFFLSWKKRVSRDWEAIDFYLICVLVVTALSAGRIGAHSQYVVELVVASLLYLVYATGFPFVEVRKPLVSIQILILVVYAPLFVFVEEGVGNITSYRAAKEIFPVIQSGSGQAPGPILSQQASFPLFARGGIYIQLFHFSGLARAGLWDQDHILEPIDDRVFSWVITQFAIENGRLTADDRERFTPEMVEALRKSYRLEKEIAPYYLYTPKPPPGNR